MLACSWLRQLTDDATGYGETTRAIQLEYGYDQELTNYPDEIELWSDDYTSVTRFFDDVEQAPQFFFMLEQDYDFSGVYVRDAAEIVDE